MLLKYMLWEFGVRKFLFVDHNYGWYGEAAIILFCCAWFAYNIWKER